jgi:hypothetical protein
VDDAVVYLVPIGSGRYELYSDAPNDDASGGAHPRDAFWRRQLHRLHQRWQQAAHSAHAARTTLAPHGRLARARDWMIRLVAESIAEQRALWSLRGAGSALFVYPADLSNASAAAARERLLTHARRRHGWWLLVNLVAVAVCAILVLLPGPNLIGYYFAFRVVGHFLSWRGAREGLVRTAWHGRAEPVLTALGRLAHEARDRRADDVARLVASLHLPRLAAFFDRVAVPAP